MAKFRTSKSQNNAIVDETGKVCYIDIMRRYTASHKPACGVTEKLTQSESAIKKFPTGSMYEGTVNVVGMYGYGAYEFPHESKDVMYEGNFEDGDFHGEGEYRYIDGTVLSGNFEKGKMLNRRLIFSDGLIYSETGWLYCQAPDRRFTIEYEEGLQPGATEFKAADQPTREIAPESYDVGYGVFDPEKRIIHRYTDPTKLIRAPSRNERKWIVNNCRDGRDVPLGPIPYLYETYTNPELILPETPRPASKSVMDLEMDDDDEDIFDEDGECRRSRRSTIGAKFKAKFFYKYERPKAIVFRESSPSVQVSEESTRASKASRASSQAVRDRQTSKLRTSV